MRKPKSPARRLYEAALELGQLEYGSKYSGYRVPAIRTTGQILFLGDDEVDGWLQKLAKKRRLVVSDVVVTAVKRTLCKEATANEDRRKARLEAEHRAREREIAQTASDLARELHDEKF